MRFRVKDMAIPHKNIFIVEPQFHFMAQKRTEKEMDYISSKW